MIKSQIRSGESTKGSSHQAPPISCQGEFCSLVHSLDPHRDILHNPHNGKVGSNEVESRDRAFLIIKRLFTRTELESLEESGKLIHLRIPQKICPFIQRSVPKESILASRKEHRLAFLELTQAEDISLSSGELCCRTCNNKENKDDNKTLLPKVGSAHNHVPACEMCYYVYRLMSHARCLLEDNYTSTPLGAAESDSFSLNKVIKQSVHAVNKVMKRNTLSRTIPTQPKVIQSPDASGSQPLQQEFQDNNINYSNLGEGATVRSPSLSPSNNVRKKRKTRKLEHQNVTKDTNHGSDFLKKEASSNSFKRTSGDITRGPTSVCHFDQKTSFPYVVIGERSTTATEHDNTAKKSQENIHNLVVCHDIFDTYERMEIFLSSFIETHPHHRILLWNYPGQAYTTYSPTQSLNNDFHAQCLINLLKHVGPEGTNEFDSTKPFFLCGHGHGGSIACTYAAKCGYIPGLRGLCLINPLTFIDVHFASVMHDCRNVFNCSPQTRPDLPLYFYSRFVFSQDYLQKVSTPLALNLYTAVHNPITIQGRVSLCNGVLNNTDIREAVKQIKAPIISVHGSKAELIRPLHAKAFLEGRDQCSTIRRTLDQKGKNKTLLLMIEGGHELLQEKKQTIMGLFEEILMGFHSVNAVSKRLLSSLKLLSPPIDKWNTVVTESTQKSDNPSNDALSNVKNDDAPTTLVPTSETYDPCCAEKARRDDKRICIPNNNKKTGKGFVSIVLDPNNPSFERQNNVVYKPGVGAIYPSSGEHTKPQEYMSWRLQRNKKRLSRFQKAARIIQGSLRVYMAKTMIARLKRQRSAMNIQRCYRGMLGRRIFRKRLKELWAARLVQRTYRGALGRRTSYFRRMSIQAQINIARVWRGYVDRQHVKEIVTYRNIAAINLQSLWRRCMAIDRAQTLRKRKFCSTNIQRIFRGYKGRRKADKERDKFIFSKSQSMGIELGRQMLAEHKLHATRLQSELSILDKERTSLESKVDTITVELDNFQKQATKLEKTMHEISMVEALKRSDVAAQHAIRQKKVQLDHDFSRLLAKISDRKNQLKVIEEKICLLDKNKIEKRDKLKKLERKLVAILEAQENELGAIKRRQEEKIETIAKTGVIPQRSYIGDGLSSTNPERAAMVAHEKKQAAKLMDSTETMMKFGFMSMAMTYFTSMNMVGAMKNITTSDIKELEAESLQINPTETLNQVQVSELSQREMVNVMKWDVDNVIQWLSTIYLAQYEEQFRDASIDGPFLCQLTDDDLKEALGIEHVLHRKKLLLGIRQLKSSIHNKSTPVYAQHDQLNSTTRDTKMFNESIPSIGIDDVNESLSLDNEVITRSNPPSIDQLSRWIRNQKDGKIKETLSHCPDADFDQDNIRVQFVEGLGTAYIKSVDDQVFHINKCDEHGNTLMHVAAQNGNMKIAMFLIKKGANPNHQNKQGQTPGHFALSYQFYDFASWLFDPYGGRGNDLLTNIYGLGPYDGLTDEE